MINGNLDGYKDYDGPSRIMYGKDDDDNDSDDDDENNPLNCGLWMDGDSLAPPCGSSISFIHSMLNFANVTDRDILWDLGCGDGRICLEALLELDCQHCVCIEIESDLVEKANSIISKLPREKYRRQHPQNEKILLAPPRIQVLEADLRECLDVLVDRQERKDSREELDQTQQSANSDDGGIFSTLPMPTIVVLSLLPESIRTIEDKLLTLIQNQGIRIVCISWGLLSIQASEQAELYEEEVDGGQVLPLSVLKEITAFNTKISLRS